VPIESRQVSERFLQLVSDLTPPGRRYHVSSPAVYRTRFVLFMLAYLADDDGQCTISLRDLSSQTTLLPPMIRTALRELETECKFVRITRTPSAPNTYQLDAEQLRARQFAAVLEDDDEPSIEILASYGLDVRSTNALRREEITTLAKLGEVIAGYRAQSDGGLPLHSYLGIRNLGVRSADKLLAAYDQWCADEAGEEPQPA
jgi:hypothetical protein